MKVFWHLLAADLRRLRVPLAVWIVVVAANTMMEGGGLLLGATAPLSALIDWVSNLLWAAEILLMFLIVSLVIHAHPTVGTDAFWLTRPIPPLALLASKLGTLTGVLVVVPALADAVLLAVYSVPAAIAAGVITQRASVQILATVLLSGVAALTRNLARYAMLSAAIILSLAVGIGAIVAIEAARLSEQTPDMSREWTDPTTNQFVAMVVLGLRHCCSLSSSTGRVHGCEPLRSALLVRWHPTWWGSVAATISDACVRGASLGSGERSIGSSHRSRHDSNEPGPPISARQPARAYRCSGHAR